ncbi:MAG: HupE/UreJ family protein [Pseudomonadota bacterium]
MTFSRFQIVFVGLALAALATPALAHSGAGVEGGFMSGLGHPIGGLDHLVAMVAVGLWGAVLGRPAIWILPIVFPLVMAIGAAMGITGISVPFIELGIALSGVVLGLFIVFFVKTPMVVAAVLVGLFAIFHGHAHGTEMGDDYNGIAYAVGFVISTGLLHLAGIALGSLTTNHIGKWVVRASGVAIALVAGSFLLPILMPGAA